MKLYILLILLMDIIFGSGIVFSSEYRWEKVKEKSDSSIPFLKTTVRLSDKEEQTLKNQLAEAIECPINLEEFNELPINTVIAKTPCNHFFCYQPLVRWMKSGNSGSTKQGNLNQATNRTTCPLCQQSFINGSQTKLIMYKKKKRKVLFKTLIKSLIRRFAG